MYTNDLKKIETMSATMAWYREGGPLMHAVLLVGLVGVAILLERFYVIVLRSKNNGRHFIERVIQQVHAGRIEEAIKACAGATAALPDIGLVILRSRSRDESDLENVASAASLSLRPKLTRRLHYLPTLATTSVLLGALGTAFGTQRTLRSQTAYAGQPGAVGAALASALGPTEFGLIVAVVLLLGRAYLVDQSESISEQMQEFSARLINALSSRPDVRLGHR
jgi:biopolymer transport protein ExbB